MEDRRISGKGGGKKGSGGKPDFATIGGLVLAALGLLGGLLLEGGSMKDITQPTAAIIVLGGTFGAVMVNFPMSTLIGGIGRLRHVATYGRSFAQIDGSWGGRSESLRVRVCVHMKNSREFKASDDWRRSPWRGCLR